MIHVVTGDAPASPTDTSAATISGAGVVTNRHHKGATVALAPDGTAPIDEGTLTTDDGVVLSWEPDRIRLQLEAPAPGTGNRCA